MDFVTKKLSSLFQQPALEPPPRGPPYRQFDSATAEIRVLLVEPGRDNSPVYRSTKVIALEAVDHTVYETISYCWVDATKRAKIVLNGAETDVPASSYAALRRIRLGNRQRTIWIDAVCINQTDLDERAQQVSLMSRVYQCASSNQIYLGEDEEDVANITLLFLRAAAHKLERAMRDLPDHLYRWQHLCIPPDALETSPPLSNSDIVELSELYLLPWFRRLWIVQGATFARTNNCIWGRYNFDLEPALRVASVASRVKPAGFGTPFVETAWYENEAVTRGVLAASKLGMLTPTGAAIEEGHEGGRVYALFILAHSFDATDQRDFVFGLVTLMSLAIEQINRRIPKLLSPNYRKSAKEVFRDATRAMLQLKQTWIFASWDGPPLDTRCTELGDVNSSWSVRWGQGERRSRSFWLGNHAGVPVSQFGDQYEANFELPVQDSDPNVITLAAFRIGKISGALQSRPTSDDGIYNRSALPEYDIAITAATSVISTIEHGFQFR